MILVKKVEEEKRKAHISKHSVLPYDVIALKDYPTEFIQPAKFSNEKLLSLFQISPVVLALKIM